MARIAQKRTNEYKVKREINEYNNPRVELGTLPEFDGRQNTVEGFIKQIQQIFDTYPDLPQGNEQYVRVDGSAVVFGVDGTVTNRLNNEVAPGTNWQALKLKRRSGTADLDIKQIELKFKGEVKTAWEALGPTIRPRTWLNYRFTGANKALGMKSWIESNFLGQTFEEEKYADFNNITFTSVGKNMIGFNSWSANQ